MLYLAKTLRIDSGKPSAYCGSVNSLPMSESRYWCPANLDTGIQPISILVSSQSRYWYPVNLDTGVQLISILVSS